MRSPFATAAGRFLLLAVGFFALYALTAQRGLGWGDSGAFQFRILSPSFVSTGSLATDHPYYIRLCRAVCSTPFAVNLVSAFFGALAVGGFFLASRRFAFSVLFGLSHMLWWQSCLAEVQTMNLALTAFETWCLVRLLAGGRGGWLVALAFLNGLHFGVHNFAILAWPVYVVVALALVRRRGAGSVPALAFAALAWALPAAVPISEGLIGGGWDWRRMLVGEYGAQALGIWPRDWVVAAFNFALAALTFYVPAALLWWRRRESRGRGGEAADALAPARPALLALLAVNAVFWLRYFVPDQATFALPTAFFAWLLVSSASVGSVRLAALGLHELLLPVLAMLVLRQLPQPAGRTPHRHRDDARYFALPWKFDDDSADRAAAEFAGEWDGYPECSKEGWK